MTIMLCNSLNMVFNTHEATILAISLTCKTNAGQNACTQVSLPVYLCNGTLQVKPIPWGVENRHATLDHGKSPMCYILNLEPQISVLKGFFANAVNSLPIGV